MSELPFVPDPVEAEAISRFVELTRDLSFRALAEVRLDDLPERDRTYVFRLGVLLEEDRDIVARQRLVWTKLRHRIPLLEGEARELLEVLGCRGFYDVALDLSGMTFANLDLRGAVVGGSYRCRYATVRGTCDETGIAVAGEVRVNARRVDGVLRGPWAAPDDLRTPWLEGAASAGDQLNLPRIDAGKSEARLTPAARAALAPPRVPSRVSADELSADSAILQLSDDDFTEEGECQTTRPRAPDRVRHPGSWRPRREPPSSKRSGSAIPGRAPLLQLHPSVTELGVGAVDTRDIDAAW